MNCADGTKAHRWRIATPDGPQSMGQCAKCGATKVFKNSDALLTHSDYQNRWRFQD